MSHDNDIDIAELAALADGSLPPERADALRRRIADDPELAAALARQERAVAAMRSTDAVAAPASLRARVRALEPERSRSGARAWLVPAGALAVIIIAVVGILAITGGNGTGEFDELADLGGRPATAAAPAEDPAQPVLLDRAVDGVVFPRWEPEFAIAAVGAREDELDGETVGTVYYGDPDDPISYSILAGDPLDPPDDAVLVTTDNGVDVRVLDGGGAVTWEREGHTCLLSGGGLSDDELVELASWMGGGAVTF